MRYNKINIVRVKESKTIIDVKEQFKERKDFFSFREKAYEEKLEFECLQCGQKISISKSSRNNLYFKHNPNTTACLLKDSRFSESDWEIYKKIVYSKESDRHKFLKEAIGNKLQRVAGIDLNKLWIDDRYLIIDGEKRRPDVYCEFRDRKIVFEIQLSDLSPRYMIERNSFYEKHGIYLIWILDNFNYLNQSNSHLNIKYLSGHQNFFVFNESSSEFKLDCRFKKNYIFEKKEVRCKWQTATIGLESLIFEENHKEVYYYHYENGKKSKDEYLKRLNAKKQKSIVESKMIQEKAWKISRVEEFIKNLKFYYKHRIADYSHFRAYLENSEKGELQIINERIGYEKSPNKLFLFLETTKNKNYQFLSFILDVIQIKMDINLKNDKGKTIFEIIVSDLEFSLEQLLSMVKSLLHRGYILQESDFKAWTERGFEQKDSGWYYLFEKFTGGQHLDVIEKVFEMRHGNVVLMIESVKRNIFIHSNYGSPSEIRNWVAFANNAIEYYAEYWEFIELAFQHYGNWEEIVNSDLLNKQSLNNKMERYQKNKPKIAVEFVEVFFELYEEVYNTSPDLKNSHSYYLIDWGFYSE
ncbi:Competence protein CoiA-like family protein [Aquiflexum balticum DSM 16537]|uniref:Competence protein CoiA-like family protein n=1 Tax=Aquiflexum balticum DSM 16537 TaxID=758820 RepID=A0A1W2H7A3_9BACT|nr:DUF6035 family protein [Aquiflexum balticum]SMD44811.1 Competence protein CoiA-like family protein [Aquiflexum balticum DSM 16537]